MLSASVVDNILVVFALADRCGVCLSLQFDKPPYVICLLVPMFSQTEASCQELHRDRSPFCVVLSSEQPAISCDFSLVFVSMKLLIAVICMRRV